MSTTVDLTVGKLKPATLTEGSEHRRALPAAYNAYARTAHDPSYRREWEAAQAILRPLFTTSFLLDDQLADAGFHDAEAVILTSASSKTAIGLAHQLRRRETRPQVVGLTSAGNRTFVERLGLYDQVLAYDDLGALDALGSAVLVDFAGRDALLKEAHRRLGDRLKLSLRVGVTHWDAERGGSAPEHGPAPVWFFAPDRMVARNADWGREAFDAYLSEAWSGFVPSTAAWLKVVHADGGEAARSAFARLVDGTADPAEGIIVRPGPES
jgi:hypothetical protein